MFKTPKQNNWKFKHFYAFLLVKCIIAITFTALANQSEIQDGIKVSKGSYVNSIEDNLATNISSVGETSGTLNFQFSFEIKDDVSDDLPTLINLITIRKGKYNEIENWKDFFSEVSLYYKLEKISGTIYSDKILFHSNPKTFGSINSKSSKVFSLQIKIKKSLPPVIQQSMDGRRVSFAIDNYSFITENEKISSQFSSDKKIVQSAKFKNIIAVVATHLKFIQQPSNTVATAIISPPVSVEAVDVFGNRDLNDSSSINLQITTTNCGYLTGNTEIASEGYCVFENLSPQVMENNINLTASATGLASAISTNFNVTASGAITSTLVNWNFDDKDFIVDAGTVPNINQTISFVVGGSPNINYVSGAGGSNSSALSVNKWNNGSGTKYWVIELETTGYQTLILSSKHRSSSKGPADFKLQYKIGNTGNWTDIPSGTIKINSTTNWTTVSGLNLPASCNNQPLLFIRWVMTSNFAVDGTSVTQPGASHIEDILIRGTTPSASANLYFKSITSGDFESPCSWQISSDNINWRQAPTYPDYTAFDIIVSQGHSMKINQPITVDELTVDVNATLELTDVSLSINDGPGTDLKIYGTYIDGASSAHNSSFANNATWLLGPKATYIKTRNSSSMNYRDAYEGGMIQIPDSANWIIRYIGQSDVSFTTINTYYPNLIFENISTTPHYIFNQKFTGSSDFLTVKGNLDIGGSGLNTLTVFNENTNTNPMVVQGNCVIKAGNIFSNKKTVTSGTGLEIKGDLTVNGTLSIQSPNSILKLSGSANQKISGSGTINTENLTAANTGGGVFMEKDLSIPGNMRMESSKLDIGNYQLSLSGIITYNTGKFFGSSGSVLTIKGSGNSIGDLAFDPGGQLLDTLIIDRIINNNKSAVNLSTDLALNNLQLINGIITTGDHLLTFKNEGGAIIAPLPQSVEYKNSYVCLCDSSGDAIVFNKPFDGNKGFRINKCATNTFFPIGIDFNTPNRMWINNTGNVDNLTVIMEKGDIGNTPLPRVNRIWYIAQSDTTQKLSADMKLFFTKKDWTKGFPTYQDEIEPGFLWSDVRLVQKDYNDPNYIEAAVDADICNYINTIYDDTEIFGKLSIGVSPDASGAKNGINSFNRFSVLNLNDIILPLQFGRLNLTINNSEIILNFPVYHQENIIYYQIEKSVDGISFNAIGSIPNQSNLSNTSYRFTDENPVNGINYYRIMAIEIDKNFLFSSIENIHYFNTPSISIFPNPVYNDFITIEIEGYNKGYYSFILTDINGRKLFSEKINHAEGRGKYLIKLPSLSKGVYFGWLIGNGKVLKREILIK